MTYRWRIRIYVIFYVDMVLRAVTYGCYKMNKGSLFTKQTLDVDVDGKVDSTTRAHRSAKPRRVLVT